MFRYALKRKKYKCTLDTIRRLNRKVIWPQRKLNRLIIKYDKHIRRLAYDTLQTK